MISIKKYTEKLNNIWDDFIIKSNNGTIFHTQQFLNYHSKGKFKNHSLLFFDDNNLVGVLPAAIIQDRNKKVLYSHPGASFGGFVCNNLSFEKYNNMILALEEYSIKNNFNIIRLINTPSIYYKIKNNSLDYLIQWRGFFKKEIYISHYLKNNMKTQSLSFLHKRKQRYIKNIIRNKTFSIKESHNFEVFYPILIKSKNLFKTQPTHSLKELLILKNKFSKEIHLLLFYKNKKIAGGSVIFFTSNNTALIFYNAIDSKFKKDHLSTFQLYNCIKFAKKNNKEILDFGVSHTPESPNPLDPKFSLIQFKEHFGTRGVVRTIYEKNINV